MERSGHARHGATRSRRRPSFWQTRGLLSAALLPVSWIYAAVWHVRRLAYQTGLRRIEHVPVPVVVVGNVVAGGGGKTPLVIALAHHLFGRGIRVGVVSRGYGRTQTKARMVLPTSTADEVGDEPLAIRSATEVPVAVAPNRAEAARLLLAQCPDVQCIISDDGLQHLQLARDLELCTFSNLGIGNGRLLPAGPLREPWPRRADWVLAPEGCSIDGIDGAVPVVRRLAANAVNASGSLCALAALAGQPVLALAGIAQPEVFFQMLRDAGISDLETLPLADHADLSAIQLPAGLAVLCTRKDAVKLWRLHPEVWAVDLELALPSTFWAQFDRQLDAKLSSPHGPTTH